MYKLSPEKVLATRQYLENKADHHVSESQLAKVAGAELFVWMDQHPDFHCVHYLSRKKTVYGRVILEHFLTNPDIEVAYLRAVGLDPI